MTDRKFYKTVITFEVLSEEPIPPGMDIGNIAYEATEGDYVMRTIGNVKTELDGKQAADALLEQGSTPDFFCLTREGEDEDI